MPEIAKQRVDKAALLNQVVEDFDKIKSKHKAQVEEFDGEIGKMRKELHTGEQDRTVLCVEVFRRGEDGDGLGPHAARGRAGRGVRRKLAECVTEPEAAAEAMIRALVERRLATPTEAQRYLPSVEGVPVDGHAPLLDQAAAAQAAEPSPSAESGDDADDGVPAEFEGGDTEDDGLGDSPADGQHDGLGSEVGRGGRRGPRTMRSGIGWSSGARARRRDKEVAGDASAFSGRLAHCLRAGAPAAPPPVRSPRRAGA